MWNVAKIRTTELRSTQRALAKEAGVSQSYIAKVELGERPIRVILAQAIDRLTQGKYPWGDWFKNGDPVYSLIDE